MLTWETIAFEYQLGIYFIIATVTFFLLYMLYSILIRKRELKRVADADQIYYFHFKGARKDELLRVFESTSTDIANIAALALPSLLFTIWLFLQQETNTFPYYVLMTMTATLAVSAISYMLSIEQFTTILSPSVSDGEKFRLYKEAVNLKFIGFIAMWGTALIALLLVHPAVMLIACFYTCALFVRHYSRRWVRPDDD